MKKLWELVPLLCRAVKDSHDAVGLFGSGHDFAHALRVGQMAMRIAPDERTGALAGIAGLCHNADRILQQRLGLGRRKVEDGEIRDLLTEWMATSVSDLVYMRLDTELDVITEAVVRHSRSNSDDDHLVQVVLQDADRLVNLEPDLIMRCSQHYSEIPAVDPLYFLDDPKATFREPRSVLRQLSDVLEWADPNNKQFGLRLPLAQKLGKKRAIFLRSYIEKVKQAYEHAGLLPCPSFLRSPQSPFAQF